ncbi:MAG: hypothetical protein WA268_28900 [Xanthobacteraceae bacterium]
MVATTNATLLRWGRGIAAKAPLVLRACAAHPGAAILGVSGCVAAAIFSVTEPRHYAGDTNSYFIYAEALAKLTINPGVHYRAAGYPWLITATLYPWTKSLLGILAAQAAFAALTPWLIYKILSYVSKPVAIVAAVLSIASLLPNLFQTLLFPDQAQMFMDILFCYVLIRYWFGSTTKNMVWLFTVYAGLSFLRPLFLLDFILLPLVVGAPAWRHRKQFSYAHYLKPFAALSICVACLHISAAALDQHFYTRAQQEKPSMNGKMLFLNAFVDSVGVPGAFNDGKYTTIFRNKLVDFFRNAPADLRNIRNLRPDIAGHFIQYQDDPPRMVDAILSERNNETWWILFNISELYFGGKDDPLFMKVALEQYWLHPKIAWNVLSRGFSYYLGARACEAPPSGGPSEYQCSYFYISSPKHEYVGYPQFGPYTGMGIHAERLLGKPALAEIEAPFTAYATAVFPYLYRAILGGGALLMLGGLIFSFYRIFFRKELCRTQSELPVLLAVTAVYLLYIGPMIVLTDPEFRYVSAGALFLLMSGLLSLRMLLVAGSCALRSADGLRTFRRKILEACNVRY